MRVCFGRSLAFTGAVAGVLAVCAGCARDLQVLDNGTIRVGVGLDSGGAITYLSLSSEDRNIVNNFDRGRQIQQSYYAGQPINRVSEGQSPSWSPWPWNPISVGDAFGHSSEIIQWSNDGNTIYAKTRPLLWDMNNEFAECCMESWVEIRLNTVHVRNRLTCSRTDDRWIVRDNDQELPAVYTIGDLPHLYTYDGSCPFTGGQLSVITRPAPAPGEWPWSVINATEKWCAHVDDNQWGLGVYNHNAQKFAGGFSGSPGGRTHDASTGYISPIRVEALGKDSVYEYEFDLIVGTLAEIRAFVYSAEGYPDKR